MSLLLIKIYANAFLKGCIYSDAEALLESIIVLIQLFLHQRARLDIILLILLLSVCDERLNKYTLFRGKVFDFLFNKGI